MSEDGRTLWVGNLDEKVTEALLYELILQTGPMERLIFVTEGEGENKKHTGQAFIVFKHADSVQYATQILEGSSLFAQQLMLKARSLPAMYKSSGNNSVGDKGRFDNSLRTGFNKATTWHGQSDMAPRGRGNYRGRGGASNYNQNSGYNNTGYNNYSQGNSNFWVGGQQASSDTQGSYGTTNDASVDEKRQKGLHQQSLQQGVTTNMTPQMYGMVPQQRPQQQGMWSSGGGYNTGDWSGTSGDATAYSGYNNRSGW